MSALTPMSTATKKHTKGLKAYASKLDNIVEFDRDQLIGFTAARPRVRQISA
jgi:hypothetical protein